MNVPVQTSDPLTSKMAAWPEPGTESKAPDSNRLITGSGNTSTNQSADVSTASSTQSQDSEEISSSTLVEEKPQVEKKSAPGTEVTNLNDNQLKALLDEALTYKCPKDREGKSDLFRKLLDKAEADKPACGDVGHSDTSARSSGFRRYRGGRRDASAASTSETKGGSLQNLAQESPEFDQLGATSGRGRKSKKGGIGVSVSARQREGGSLPSNVNVGGCGMRTPLLFESYSKCGPKKKQDFPLQMAEFHRSQLPDECVVISVNRKGNEVIGDNGEAMDCDDGTEMEVMTKNYTTRATLEVGQGDAPDMDREVDSQVVFPINRQMESINGSDHRALQLSSSYNSVKSLTTHDDRMKPKVPGETILFNDAKFAPSQHVSEISITPAKRSSNWSTSALASADSAARYVYSSCDDKGKSYDENGNAVGSMTNNSDRRGKSRKSKPKENYTKFVAEEVSGYQGDKDLESLLKFIESDKDGESKGKVMRNNNNQPRAAAMAPKGAKSRDRKLTKSEDCPAETEKMKRSNSLEEISKTKLEDLTAGVTRRPKKQSTLDEGDLRGDRRSWGTEAYYSLEPVAADVATRKGRDEATEETEFHIVTKKQRKKKQRRSSSGGREDGRQSQGSQPQRDAHQPRRGNNAGFPPHDRDILYQYRRPRSPDMRRKSTSSMPPSDKSDSSDLDSVHSLPVSSTTPKSDLDPGVASYADIAKSCNATPNTNAININVNATKWPPINAQFITSSKISIGAPPVSASRLNNAPVNFKTVPLYHLDNDDSDNSANKFTKNCPSLEDNYSICSSDTITKPAINDVEPTHKQCSDKSERSDSKLSSVKASHPAAKEGKATNMNKRLSPPSTRPAVIILDEKESLSVSQNLTSEITFGFEINELLLMSDEDEEGEEEDNGDSFNSAYSTEVVPPLDLEAFMLRYRAPAEIKPTPDLEAVVNFIGCAWEEVKEEGCVVWSDQL